MHEIKHWVWNEGIFELLCFFKQQGFLLCLITNQSGIHRQYFSFTDFCRLSLFMQQDLLKKIGFMLDRIYFCPHEPNEACLCRKPKTGMFNEAINDFPSLSLSDSILIGDSWTDILAARNMKLKQAFWLTKHPFEQKLYSNEKAVSHLTQILSEVHM